MSNYRIEYCDYVNCINGDNCLLVLMDCLIGVNGVGFVHMTLCFLKYNVTVWNQSWMCWNEIWQLLSAFSMYWNLFYLCVGLTFGPYVCIWNLD